MFLIKFCKSMAATVKTVSFILYVVVVVEECRRIWLLVRKMKTA